MTEAEIAQELKVDYINYQKIMGYLGCYWTNKSMCIQV